MIKLYKKSLLIVAALVFFFAGFFSRSLSRSMQRQLIAPSVSAGVTRETGYAFIKPLLSCNFTDTKEFTEFRPLESRVQTVIDRARHDRKADDVSVYFRDLDQGHWIGINENAQFSPASLLKVPTMIAFYKLAESQPEILQKQITYSENFDDNQFETIQPVQKIEHGKTYTIQQLIEAMIKYSDNNATRLLHENIDMNSLNEVYTDLGLSIPQGNGPIDFMSSKTYAYFFRILYNATYLDHALSEKALELLSYQDFPEGIDAGVPKNVKVADKFGERTVQDPDGTVTQRELHDCGIVYYSDKPYMLCIMTKGKNFDDLKRIIKDISATIYKEVDAGFPN